MNITKMINKSLHMSHEFLQFSDARLEKGIAH